MKLDDLSTCNDLIAKHGAALQRSLNELDGLRVPYEGSEKLKAVNERATLFRITSNAMINVSAHPCGCPGSGSPEGSACLSPAPEWVAGALDKPRLRVRWFGAVSQSWLPPAPLILCHLIRIDVAGRGRSFQLSDGNRSWVWDLVEAAGGSGLAEEGQGPQRSNRPCPAVGTQLPRWPTTVAVALSQIEGKGSRTGATGACMCRGSGAGGSVSQKSLKLGLLWVRPSG